MASSSPANKPVVLVDATPLRSPSGNRGIGRYVHDLFVGLEAIRDEWSAQLDIVALTDLSRTGAPLYERDLAHAASSTVEKKDAVSQKQIRWRRRLFVERAARRIGASLLHETEAIGTPLRLSVPRVVTCYDLIPLRFRKQYIGSIAKYPSRWLTEWRRYSIAERVVCISDRSNQDVRALLKLPQSQVFTVRTGIDLAKWVALSREPQLPLSKVG
ncbi:MAG: glycosyltransferase, partial [Polyangiaceae bacterium]